MSDVEKLVVFRLGEELYAFPIAVVDRIVGEVKVTPVPNAPSVVLGVFDLRGEAVMVVDLGRRLGSPGPTSGRNHMVVQCRNQRIALRVDGVEGIYCLPAGSVSSPPALVRGQGESLLTGVAQHKGRLIAILDPGSAAPEGAGVSVVTPA